MNKKYFLALASVAVSVAIYSCGSGDVVDFYNDDIDGVPGQAMLDEMNFTNTLQDESVVNNYKDKYGNGSVPPPESSSSVDPIPTDSTPTGGGEIPLSSSVPEFPLSSSSIGIILPPVSSGEDGSSSSATVIIPPLSSSSNETPWLSSSSTPPVLPQSSSSSAPTPVSSSSANSPVGGDVIEITGAELIIPIGIYTINIGNVSNLGCGNNPDENPGENIMANFVLTIGGQEVVNVHDWHKQFSVTPNSSGILEVKDVAIKCNGWYSPSP